MTLSPRTPQSDSAPTPVFDWTRLVVGQVAGPVVGMIVYALTANAWMLWLGGSFAMSEFVVWVACCLGCSAAWYISSWLLAPKRLRDIVVLGFLTVGLNAMILFVVSQVVDPRGELIPFFAQLIFFLGLPILPASIVHVLWKRWVRGRSTSLLQSH